MIIIYFAFLLFIFFPISVNAMQPEPGSPETPIEGYAPFQTLPAELTQKIILFLTAADTPEQAVKQIKKFLSNPALISWWEKPEFIDLLVYQMERNFRTPDNAQFERRRPFNLIDAALVFDEPHVMWWLINKIREGEDIYILAKKKINKILFNLLYKHANLKSLPRTERNFLEIIFDFGIITPDDFGDERPAEESAIPYDMLDDTPLKIALSEGDVDLIKFLLDMGADPNRKGAGRPDAPLGVFIRNAARFNHQKIMAIIKLLLDAGADFDIFVGSHHIYFPFAVLGAYSIEHRTGLEILELLLQHGLNPLLARIYEGETQISLLQYVKNRAANAPEALKTDYEEVVRLLMLHLYGNPKKLREREISRK